MIKTQTYANHSPHRPEALFFDSNETMLDLSVMAPAVADALGGRDDLMSLWFATMLQHSLVDTVTSNYHDLGAIGAACLQMVAEGHGIGLSSADARKAVSVMRTLPAHPDVPSALQKLKSAGFRMYALTNSAGTLMEAQLEHAGIAHYFDGRLSVDALNVYKPHPRTYRWAAHQVDVPVEGCMMIAAHGWDVAGARLAGMRAAFVQRPGKMLYPLGPPVEVDEPTLDALADRLIAMPK